MICRAWLSLVQRELYGILRTHDNGGARRRCLVLADLRYPHPGRYTTSIKINAPVAENATLDLSQDLFVLLCKTARTEQGGRMSKLAFQLHIMAVTGHEFSNVERSDIYPTSGLMCDVNRVSSLLGKVTWVKELVFVLNLSEGLED